MNPHENSPQDQALPSQAPPNQSTVDSSRPSKWWYAILACLCLVTYSGALFNGFTNFDDTIYVTQSRHVQQGISLSSLYFAWTTTAYGNWHPLTWMSLELDYQLFGLWPTGFHATNLLLHLLTVLILFRWLALTTRQIECSAVAAALFAIHPLHVESVAWIGERKDVLSAFFLMLTLLAYHHYAGKPRLGQYLLVTFCFACGLLSKSMLVTVPCLLMVVDFWPEMRVASRGSLPQLIKEKFPWLAMSLVMGVVTVLSQGEAGNIQSTMTDTPMFRLGTAASGLAFYLQKTFWPTGLTPFYPLSSQPAPAVAFLCGMFAATVAFFALAIRQRRQRPWLLFGAAWFLISLLPVIGLLQVGQQAYADRYSYVPHIGLVTLLVWQANDWLRRWRPVSFLRPGMAATALGACAFLTFTQVKVWKDSETLWQHTLSVDEANWLAHYQLATMRMEKDENDAAAVHLARAEQGQPNDAKIQDALGYLAMTRGDWETAKPLILRAVELDPRHREAHHHLYHLRMHFQEFDLAEEALQKHCQIASRHLEARCELGTLKAYRGNLEGALEEFERVLEIDPRFAQAHVAAAEALLAAGRLLEARDHLLASLKITQRIPKAHVLIADELMREKNPAGAAKYYQAALALSPDDAETRAKLRALQP